MRPLPLTERLTEGHRAPARMDLLALLNAARAPTNRTMVERDWALAFVVLVFGLYLYSVLMMRVAAKAGLGVVLLSALGQCAWLVTAAAIAGSGYLVSDVLAMPPLILRVILAPALLVVFAIAYSPRIQRSLAGMRGDWLVSIQAFRIFMELVLHGLYQVDALPERLTFSGLNFDIVSGLLALPVGYLMHKGRAPTWLVIGYNVVGLLLLATIVVMALLSAPTPLQVFSDPPGTRFVFHVPFVWLPAYVVPTALLYHLLSLRHALRQARAPGRELPVPA